MNKVETKKSALFIINPIAGTRSKKSIPRLIEEHIDKEKFNYNISFTEYASHAAELCKSAVDNGIDIIIASGGDGTVNEIIPGLIDSSSALYVLPTGSGNGLARELNISLNIEKAIRQFNSAQESAIDIGRANDRHFISVAGLAFEAAVVKNFQGIKRRGILGYAKTILNTYFSFQPIPMKISMDNEELEDKYFMFTVSNSGQYGYGVKPSKSSNMSDGILDILIVKQFPKWRAVYLIPYLLLGIPTKSKYVDIYFSSKVEARMLNPSSLQADGEMVEETNSVNFTLNHKAIKILKPTFK